MKKIIVLNGKGRSGKDLFVKLTRIFLSGTNFNIYSISSVDKVKEIAYKMGWNGEKNDKARTFLHMLKTIWTDYNNGPLNYINQYLKLIDKYKDDAIVFLHIREPIEIDKVRKITKNLNLELITILVKRKESDNPTNFADDNCENYNYDIIVENNGTMEDYEESVKLILKDLKLIE